jgi:N-acetylneuraminate synthase
MQRDGAICIVAEAGVNHNGSPDMALRLVDSATEAGADAVKFQTFRADRISGRDAPKARYQLATTGASETQFEMLKRLELDEAAHRVLLERCRLRGIEFLSTPFDLESVSFLAVTLGIRRLKISSGDLTNAPLLLKAARTGKPVLLSTGMGTLEDIEEALGVLSFGYAAPEGAPSGAAFRDAYRAGSGKAALRERVTLLHCTTEYPAPFEEANLLAMDAMRSAFGLPVGLSDHTEGWVVPVAAAARGAVVIEKHFTLDRTLPGPDHKASLEPAAFREMVRAIRTAESSLGSGEKVPSPSERRNIAVVRKSLVAVRAIRKGERFTEENVGIKRPGGGLPPLRYWELLGKTAKRDFAPDEYLGI